MVNLCPVCGYGMKYPPQDFHICPSCGTEFGYDDAGRTHASLRADWLRGGLQWWSPIDARPDNWDPYEQVSELLSASLWSRATLPFSQELETTGMTRMLQSAMFGSQQHSALSGIIGGVGEARTS